MMKKSAKIWSIILSLVMGISVFSLAACNDPVTPPGPGPDVTPAHTHTYATEWSKDAADHWHAATCEHTTEVKDKAAHNTTGEDGACSVCGYKEEVVHEHTFAADAWKISDTQHWRAATCDHKEEKGSLANHDTAGDDGKCSVCGYKVHEHTYETKYYSTKHYQEKTCNDCPADNPDAPQLINLADHTFNENGIGCSVCGMPGTYRYKSEITGCITCATCDGCIRMQCPNEGNEGHVSCVENQGANAKRVTLETEDGEISKSNGDDPELYDGTSDARDCIHGMYCDVKWTINVSKATTVALRIRTGRHNDKLFETNGTIYVNGTEFTSKAILAAPKNDDTKCSMWWYDLGCIELQEGENTIEIFQLGGGEHLHIDKIELVTASDVTITHEKIDNSQYLISSGDAFVDMPKFLPYK